MCYYPTLIRNPKYKANKKNGGVIPTVIDNRTTWLPIPCGECLECRKKKARDWTVRLMEDIREHKNGKLVTLTFSNEAYNELKREAINNSYREENKLAMESRYKVSKKAAAMWWEKNEKKIRRARGKREGYGLDNAIATIAVRKFNERWRKKHKKAVRHWLITELGHNGTENIHMHGVIWTDESFDEIRSKWGYGYIYPRSKEEEEENYVGERSINYWMKYVTKIDKDHEYYKSIILCSAGIGANYGTSGRYKRNSYKEEGETKDTYKTRTGHEIQLPTYYRNNIYTDKQKEMLWIEKLDKQKRYVGGIMIDTKNGLEEYWNRLKQAQKENVEMGYGTGKIDWVKKDYEEARRKMMQEKREEK